jgi:hypothetical protein
MKTIERPSVMGDVMEAIAEGDEGGTRCLRRVVGRVAVMPGIAKRRQNKQGRWLVGSVTPSPSLTAWAGACEDADGVPTPPRP